MSLCDLWLEKYKPKKYYELLTEERVNREILQWLMSWDEIVFNKKKITIAKNKNNNNNQLSYYERHLQELNYKKHKYILIAGPPGLGKSTLAQVISKHCGYDYQVINASDERTSESLIHKIENATKVHNLNFTKGASQRPTCLILDEIDGIDFGVSDNKNVAKNIIDFIKSGGVINKSGSASGTNKPKFNFGFNNKAKRKNSDDSKNNNNFNKKNNTNNYDDSSDDEMITAQNNNIFGNDVNDTKQKEKEKIMRPIICICNDLYSKSIALLKKDALIFNIKKVSDISLLKRLVTISKNENLNLQKEFIESIVSQANSDIRSCLNIMHLISFKKDIFKNKQVKNISEMMLVGQKDVNQNIFKVWKQILSEVNEENIIITDDYDNLDYSTFKSIADISLNSNQMKNNKADKKISNFSSIKQSYYSVGDFELVNNGLFHNYLNLPKFQDSKKDEKPEYSGYNNPNIHDLEQEAELTFLTKLTEDFSFSERNKKRFNKENNDYILPGLVLNNYIKKTAKNPSTKAKANDTYMSIEFPISLINLRNNSNKNSKIFQSLMNSYSMETNINYSINVFINSILPTLTKFIIPNIRDISPDLLSEQEQINLLFSVFIVIKLGIKILIKEKEYEMVPNIFNLVEFNKVNKLSNNTEKNVNNLNKEDDSYIYHSTNRKIMIIQREVERVTGLRRLFNAGLVKKEYNEDSDMLVEDEELWELKYYYPKSIENNKLGASGLKQKTILDSGLKAKEIKDKSILNAHKFDVSNFVTKRTTADIRKSKNISLFHIKFHEGITNSVKRKLKFSSFFY